MTDIPEPAHAELSPSASEAWLECTGRRDLVRKIGIPWPDTVASLRGTCAHDILSHCIKRRSADGIRRLIGKIHMGVEVDAALIHGIETAFDVIWPIYRPAFYRGSEMRIPIAETGEFGTVDIWCMHDGILWIIDFKNGWYKVEAEQNTQMMLYLFGVLQNLRQKKLPLPKKIMLGIVQPNTEKDDFEDSCLQTWEPSQADLMAFRQRVLTKVAEIKDGRGALNAGEWCHFCPAAHGCPALCAVAGDAAAVSFEDFVDGSAPLPGADKLEPLSRERVARILGRIPELEALIKAARIAALITMREDPSAYPGWKVVATKTKRRWQGDGFLYDIQVAHLRNQLVNEKIKGIGEVVKILKANNVNKDDMDELLNTYLIKPEGRPVLVRESDKRTALPASAIASFDDMVDDDETPEQ